MSMEDHAGKSFKRSRSGCFTCRERRVKCDEAKPRCSNCTKITATCTWNLRRPNVSTDLSLINESSSRKRRKPIRTLPTCVPCHLAKSRCSHTPPSCERCIAIGKQCTWPERYDTTTSPTQPITPAPSNGPDPVAISSIDPNFLHQHSLPPTTFQLESILCPGVPLSTLIDAFFTHVHPTEAMSFLHQGQLSRDIKEGSASPLLIRAICAVSYRFLDSADPSHPDGGGMAAKWANEVKMWIVSDTEQVSLARLAAILCTVHHESNSGRLLSAWQWVASAARMALAMGLDSPRFMARSSSWVTQETARRLMWATVSADALWSSAHVKYKLLHTDLELDLPASEHAYRMGRRPEASSNLKDGVPGGGFMAEWVRLMLLRRSILSYACYGHQEPLKPWQPGSTFHQLEEQLRHWQDSLSDDMAFTLDNLYIRHSSTELTSLAGLHLLFDLARISLFRVGMSAVTFSGDSVYPDMPGEFRKSCARKAYAVGLAIRDRLCAIEDHFPNYTSSSRLWVRSVHASLRVQIEHQEQLDTVGEEQLDGFKTMVGTVANMTRYFSADRRTVRDLLDMLAHHGYRVIIDDDAVATRPGTPSIPHLQKDSAGDGQILPDIPWVRRSIKEPHLMDVGGPQMMVSSEPSSSLRDPPSATISALRDSFDDAARQSALDTFSLSGPTSDFLLPASNEHESEFSLWTVFQPEPPQTLVPDFESLFALP